MKVAVIGLGQRGSNYIRIISLFCKDIEIVAVCDKNKVITDQIAKKYKVEKKFYDEKDFFGAGKLADAIIVATQDRDHIRHCNLAIDNGYDKILVEKPVSPIIEECVALQKRAEEKNISIVVCHVLRYSKYYKKIKEIIQKGIIGDVMTINHTENVGYFHYAHSYVRGNWRDSSVTSPMIMAKCCHDFDLLQWFIDKKCLAVSSFGGLSYFRKENMPKGAADRCIDCKVECPYNAMELYITDPLHKATFLRFSGRILTGKSGSTKEERIEALENGNYGRCVYKSDNNVVDHQIVNMLFEGGVTASHTVTAFSKNFYRRTHVCGTKGEIIGNDLDGKLTVNIFKGKSKTIGTKWIKGLGHIDGDINLIKDWCKLIQGKLEDDKDVTYLSHTIPSHKIVMTAEESRLQGGKVLDID
ncbi:MAG: Gfo/Idh/MocA family oxidoreductase [Bacillota bacterium]|jgi:predicted dehydrogenase|nr:Gfo/Idh/MocA family oxidoreductase [Bacillota bacterium]HHU43990.1 Gfo/Idh/MocA family oxidoreductase [Clostridiales bacterium]